MFEGAAFCDSRDVFIKVHLFGSLRYKLYKVALLLADHPNSTPDADSNPISYEQPYFCS